MPPHSIVAVLPLLALALAGCNDSVGTQGETPYMHCPDIEVGPGIYVRGAVWHDGEKRPGAAAYAHGPTGSDNETTVEDESNEDGCFMLILPAAGTWQGQARFEDLAGDFSVDALADGVHDVVVVMER